VKRPRAALTLAGIALVLAWTGVAHAQAPDPDDAGAITARVHGTFRDAAGGVGVLSGDMMIVRFEVRNGRVTALGDIVGALADSAGNVLGKVRHQLELPVDDVASTCNQLRVSLGATDAEVLDTQIHFDKEVAGFDSRHEGMIPKALGALCATQQLLRTKPASESVAQALNTIVAAAAKQEGR